MTVILTKKKKPIITDTRTGRNTTAVDQDENLVGTPF